MSEVITFQFLKLCYEKGYFEIAHSISNCVNYIISYTSHSGGNFILQGKETLTKQWESQVMKTKVSFQIILRN